MLIFTDELAHVVLDAVIHVALGIHEELLAACLVFEAEFVEVLALSVFGTTCDDAAAGVIVGQLIWRHIRRVIKRTGDDWLIGIALEEFDYHLLSDARPEMRAPRSTGPGLGNANPAGTVGVVLAVAVPVKLHVNTTVLIKPAFLSLGYRHNSSLRPCSYRFGS